MKKKLSEIEYLYGIDKPTWDSKLYCDALQEKIRLAKKLATELQEEHYMTRDTFRVNAVKRAISFNERLLLESKRTIQTKKEEANEL